MHTPWRLLLVLTSALLVLGGSFATSTPASAQTTDGQIRIALEAAMQRWMSEYGAGGRYYRDLETRVVVDTTALMPMNAAAVTTQRLWLSPGGGKNQPIISEMIYRWSSEYQARQEYNRFLSQHPAWGNDTWHGFPSSKFSEVQDAVQGSRIWIAGNLVLVVQGESNFETLGEVLAGAENTPLEEFLYQEAVKVKLIPASGNAGSPSGGQPPAQPPATIPDMDRDGIPDSADRCKTRHAPQNPDGCPDFAVVVRCGPPDVEEGMTIACSAETDGLPDGDVVELQWEVDGKPLCQGTACQWRAGNPGSTGHNVSLTARGKPSGRQTSTAVFVPVRGAISKPYDDPSSNIVITNLSCSSDVTSDETLDCLVGFKRLDPKIKELVVIWQINGATASTSTRTDDGDVYTLAQPAPGVHTIQVFVLDPANGGRGRVMTTTARILPGKNAAIPPGAGAGAAAGTLTGIAVWLWAQWWFANRPGGKVQPGSPISRLPSSPRVERSYSGQQAKTILDSLGISDALQRLDSHDFMDPEFRARVEEVLDTHFGKRKVKGIHYRAGPDGKIDVDSIEIVVEEPEDAVHPRDMKKPAPGKPPVKKKAGPPAKPKPVAPAPEKKPPVKIPPVDPKGRSLRDKWQDAERKKKEIKRQIADTAKKLSDATRKDEKLHAAIEAQITARNIDFLVETGDLGLMLINDALTLAADTGPRDAVDALGKKLVDKLMPERLKQLLGYDSKKPWLIQRLLREFGLSTGKDTLKMTLKETWKQWELGPDYKMNLNVKDPVGLRIPPGGGIKGTGLELLQWLHEKFPLVDSIPVVNRLYDYSEQGWSMYSENKGHGDAIEAFLREKKYTVNRRIDLEHIRNVLRSDQRRLNQKADEAFANYINYMRSKGR